MLWEIAVVKLDKRQGGTPFSDCIITTQPVISLCCWGWHLSSYLFGIPVTSASTPC